MYHNISFILLLDFNCPAELNNASVMPHGRDKDNTKALDVSESTWGKWLRVSITCQLRCNMSFNDNSIGGNTKVQGLSCQTWGSWIWHQPCLNSFRYLQFCTANQTQFLQLLCTHCNLHHKTKVRIFHSNLVFIPNHGGGGLTHSQVFL